MVRARVLCPVWAAITGGLLLLNSCARIASNAPPASAVPATAVPATADVIINYSGRDGSGAHINPGFLSVNGADFAQQNLEAYTLLKQAGIGRIRLDAQVPDVFADPTPNWGYLDPRLSSISQARLKVMLIFTYTPAWLQPNPNPCSATGMNPAHAVPDDLKAYASLAAQYVHHVDTVFPGLVDSYEIWNEPDTTYWFCPPDPSVSGRISSYLSIYSAVGPAIRAQAASDGATVMIGGPTLADGGNLNNLHNWLPALVSNPVTAPYVDFISYHKYAGASSYASTVNWDSTTPSLLSLTTQITYGYMGVFVHADAYVRAGIQPNAATTPIYVTEFNTFTNANGDCCRNSPTYSPVWNTTVAIELLNSIYSGAKQPAQGIYYYAAGDLPPYQDCLLAQVNTTDCGWARGQPLTGYPQYYAYMLLGSPVYLDLQSGAILASSIQNTNPNLRTAAFYGTSADALVIANTSPTDITTLTVRLDASGFGAGAASTLYLLDKNHPTISQQTVQTVVSGDSTYLQFTVPAYSVIGIALRPPK